LLANCPHKQNKFYNEIHDLGPSLLGSEFIQTIFVKTIGKVMHALLKGTSQ
jgi:hypothetical protein